MPDVVFYTSQTRVTTVEILRHLCTRYDLFTADQSTLLPLATEEGERRVYQTQTILYDRAGNL